MINSVWKSVQFLFLPLIHILTFSFKYCHGVYQRRCINNQKWWILRGGWRNFSYSWGDVDFGRLLVSNVLHRFNNWLRWGLVILNVTPSSWTFGRCCDCRIGWWNFEAIIGGAATISVRPSLWLLIGSCSCRRSCWLFAMRNIALFLLLIANSKKVGDFWNPPSHRAWNFRPWRRDSAVRITFAVLRLLVSFFRFCFLVKFYHGFGLIPPPIFPQIVVLYGPRMLLMEFAAPVVSRT